MQLSAETSGDTEREIRVLLVDDDDAVRLALSRVLRRLKMSVTTASSGNAALELIGAERFDVVLSDVMMPGMSGIELLREIRGRDLELPVILMTGTPLLQTAMEAVEHGAYKYLTKPIPATVLTENVQRAAQLGQLAVVKRQAMELLGSTLAQAGDRAGLESTFERALASLRMAYQPLVRSADRSLFGYEALMRSSEPALPHPGAVLDAAERLDRMQVLGRRVRSLAPGPMSTVPETVSLFVNLHASDLLDPTLLDATTPLARIASQVVLEITERATLDDMNGVRKAVAQLREMGFRIAIDDLGAGYAGLTSFASLEPEIVKLDMSLVRDVDSTVTKQKLIRSVSTLCHDLGMLVVAEGIETREERDCVIELGCDLLQGYLLARPGWAFPDYVFGPE